MDMSKATQSSQLPKFSRSKILRVKREEQFSTKSKYLAKLIAIKPCLIQYQFYTRQKIWYENQSNNIFHFISNMLFYYLQNGLLLFKNKSTNIFIANIDFFSANIMSPTVINSSCEK